MTEPNSQDPSRSDARKENAIVVWLDALAQGVCPPNTFLRAMHEQFPGDSDGNWEVLALLDQYYRLGKIDADVFHTVKAGIEDAALGAGASGGATPAATPARASFASRLGRAPVRTAPVETPDVSGALSDEENDPPLTAAPPRATSARMPPMSATPRAPRTPPAQGADPIPTLHQAPIEDTHKQMRLIGVGDVLRGRYRIRRMLGEGGMGSVFEAADGYRQDVAGEGQRIAIKVLHPDIQRREELLNELQGEFQLLQALSHPNIVRVHEFDRDGDTAFFTMELLIGTQLARILSERDAVPLPDRYSFALIRDLGGAMAYAHEHGVVHGDINPQNIFITNDGELRVLDFGAASRRTPVATPGYASCQVLEGQLPERRDDVFSFACVAYILLAGRHPFGMQSALQARLQNIRPAKPKTLSGRQWRVLRQGLRFDREQRPSDLREWLSRLKLKGAAARIPSLPALLSAGPQRRSLAVPVTAVLFVAALAGVGYWAMADQDKVGAWYAEARTQVLALWAKASAGLSSGRRTTPSADTERAAEAPAETAGTNETPEAVPTSPGESRTPDGTAETPPPASHTTPAAPGVTAGTSSPASSPVAGARVPAQAGAAPRSSTAAAAASVASTAGNASGPTAPGVAPPRTARGNAASSAALAAATSGSSAPGAPVSGAAGGGASHGERAANPTYTKLEMAADNVDVPPDATAAQVVIRRRGSPRGDAAFMLWTESSTAKPGRDFTPSSPHLEILHDGSSAMTVSIPVSNAPRARPVSFYVLVDQADGGPDIVNRRVTQVTLHSADE